MLARARGGRDMHAVMALERTLYSSDHGLFRQAFRQFVDQEIRPHQKRWGEVGRVDRETWRKAGAAGFQVLDQLESPAAIEHRRALRRRAAAPTGAAAGASAG